MRIWTQKSASIQKRTSPLKFDNFAEKSEKDTVSYLSTKVAVRSETRVLSAALDDKPAAALGFLLGSSVIAVAYNVVLFQTLVTLSPVAASILSNVKIVLLVLLSAVYLGELSSWSWVQLQGCAVTFTAGGVYSYLKAYTYGSVFDIVVTTQGSHLRPRRPLANPVLIARGLDTTLAGHLPTRGRLRLPRRPMGSRRRQAACRRARR